MYENVSPGKDNLMRPQICSEQNKYGLFNNYHVYYFLSCSIDD